MKRLRQASVIAVLSLLGSAPTASAECAWVLWERSGQYAAGTSETLKLSTEPVSAYTTRANCQEVVVTQLAKLRDSAGPGVRMDKPEWELVSRSVTVLDDMQEAYVTMKTRDGKSVTTLYGYTCLPDTVDPRGLKGK